MGEFAIMVSGTGPGNYTGGSLGGEADEAITGFGELLRSLGFTILQLAILAPHSDDDVVEPANGTEVVG